MPISFDELGLTSPRYAASCRAADADWRHAEIFREIGHAIASTPESPKGITSHTRQASRSAARQRDASSTFAGLFAAERTPIAQPPTPHCLMISEAIARFTAAMTRPGWGRGVSIITVDGGQHSSRFTLCYRRRHCRAADLARDGCFVVDS